ncbi:glycoside hydrolase family 140 protein [Flammeovirgaceae bacterium SG7u.111]|nr:glycoside hydrolase family 140 protein [Flammeovirgaceae bacterium SG7u.132]WPO38040.1 glycoside hydrolase family 140 protein [Flammeovirgaceae bacterium SG7u.111]
MKLKSYFFSILAIIIMQVSNAQLLKVNESGRYLEDENGKAFLWIGDTAWELFHKLNREEAVEYLENRAAKGVSVIQAVVLAENNGLRSPNAYGDLSLQKLDPTKPNEKYFEHVDFIINKAEELGLVVGLLPTWGDKVYSENLGEGPIIFNKKNAEVFGRFLGERYKQKPIVWILGGDRNIANMEVLEIWRAMAKGLKEGDDGKHLISFHPRGMSHSAYWLHNEPWLDFNMYQSGHVQHFHHVYTFAEHLSLLQPRKPFVEGEPAYEDIALVFWEFMDFGKQSADRVPKGVLDDDGLIVDKSHFSKGFFDDSDVRVHAYWNFLSGACGYTYGNNAIWQMYKKGGGIAIPCLYDWRESMDRPGATQLVFLRKILEARPFDKIVPDQSLIYGLNPEGRSHIRAAGSSDGSFNLVYLGMGQKAMVNLHKLPNSVMGWWYNPKNGKVKKIGKFPNKGIKEFVPPSSGVGNDWLLVLDDEKSALPKLD